MKEFTITKINVLEGNSSNVRIGQTATGLLYRQTAEHAEPIATDNLDEITLGCRIIVFRSFFTFIKTSAIEKILRNGDGSLELTTETSVYYLKEANNEEGIES